MTRRPTESSFIRFSTPIVIFEGNNGCTSIANNPVAHEQSNHIDAKCHFSREQITQKIVLKYVPTGERLTDTYTKQLPSHRFEELRL